MIHNYKQTFSFSLMPTTSFYSTKQKVLYQEIHIKRLLLSSDQRILLIIIKEYIVSLEIMYYYMLIL